MVSQRRPVFFFFFFSSSLPLLVLLVVVVLLCVLVRSMGHGRCGRTAMSPARRRLIAQPLMEA